MDSFWDIFLWAAIPIAVLILAVVASAYGLTRRRSRPEDAQDRVARAYRDATSQGSRGRAGAPACTPRTAGLRRTHPDRAATAPRAGMTIQ